MGNSKTPGGGKVIRDGSKRTRSGEKRKAMVGPSKSLIGEEKNKIPLGIRIRIMGGLLTKQPEMTWRPRGVAARPHGMMDAETTSNLCQAHFSNPQLEAPLIRGPWPTRMLPFQYHSTLLLLGFPPRTARSMAI
jgi:hypothetical protein